MLETLAIENYRSVRNLTIPLGALNLITGANGTGKSNLYRALNLLAMSAQGNIISALASEGGLSSIFWAGPEILSARMKRGEVPVQGASKRKNPKRLKLGFGGPELSYAIALGLPTPNSGTMFNLDPEIKHECIWADTCYRAGATLLERNGPCVKGRTEEGWKDLSYNLDIFESTFNQIADPASAPYVLLLRENIRQWRFYDHFRTDRDAPARQPQLGTRTPVLHHDGRDLASAIRTILEIGDPRELSSLLQRAFPGAALSVSSQSDGRFVLHFSQEGLLRSLTAAELSDGTLRFILWIAALLTPRPPTLMVLNEPETSLHPDLIPALGELIVHAASKTQVWVISHSAPLIKALKKSKICNHIELKKELGETQVVGRTLTNAPKWKWPTKF